MLALLPQAVDRAAERAPEHEAICCLGESLSYGTLAERSDQLARTLVEQGVRRGDRVAILAGKGVRSAVAIHGIMKAGAAYVPLDPGAPARRHELILRDCGVRHIVSEPERTTAVLELAATGVPLKGTVGVETNPAETATWEDVENAPRLEAAPGTTADDLCYILYTSGSTGVPKGVVHTHRSALAFARFAADTYGFQPEDRLSNHAPLHFDLSTLDYFSAAVAGATTVVIPEAYTRLPASYARLMEDERLTVLYAVPVALTHLLLHGALDQRDLRSIRWVLFGGEPFPTRHLRNLMRALPEARFSNVYGPTEVNGVTYWIVPPLPEDSDEPIPIGGPYGDEIELLVVDRDDNPVRHGESGELWVRSPTMMQGYWGRPDLNERAFAERSQPGEVPARYHRTGDLVQQREDGALLFHGRMDRQIKTRGYRVELDEVEAALASNEEVEHVAVFAVPDESGSQRIHAAVTLRSPGSIDTADLLAHVGDLLPRYALPEELAILDEMPQTSSGKIDRLALRESAISTHTQARSV